MSRYLSLLSLSLIVGCGGDKTDDTGVDVQDTAPPVDPIDMKATFYDGMTYGFLVGADVCVEEPVFEDGGCQTTDATGSTTLTWENPEPTDFTVTLSLEDYMDTIFCGRYDDDVAASWAPEIDMTGSVAFDYMAFKKSDVTMFLASGGVTLESGNGTMLINLLDVSGFGIENAVVTVMDDAGAAVGTVHYANPMANAIDTAATASSASGVAVVANAPEGTYTVNVDVPGKVCVPWFSWRSDVVDSVPAPVRADTMTRLAIGCD